MKVIVIGAGATGLAAAYLLGRTGVDVTIVEASSDAGGLLSTFDVGNGKPLERFYHHFFTHDAEINWLLRDLGLDDEIVYRDSSMGMFRADSLYAFDGPRDLLQFRAIGPIARFRFGFSSALLAYRKKFAGAEDVRCLEWFQRWAGVEATRAIWDPMLRIKFGPAADDIPLAWMAGRLRQRVLSRRKGVEQLGYLTGSLQLFVDSLLRQLAAHNVELRLNTPTTGLISDNGKVVGITTSTQEMIADRVVSTVPTPILANWVSSIDRDYAHTLHDIEYLGAICTILALDEPLSSFYWTNVADPGYDFGGVIEHTNLIPADTYDNQHLVYLSRYLRPTEGLWTMPDEQLIERQLAQLSRLYRRDVAALLRRAWVFRGRFAAPLTDIGFHQKIPAFKTPLPQLYMASMCHVYPDERSVNNSIRVAAELVRALGYPDAANIPPRGLSLAAKYGHIAEDRKAA